MADTTADAQAAADDATTGPATAEPETTSTSADDEQQAQEAPTSPAAEETTPDDRDAEADAPDDTAGDDADDDDATLPPAVRRQLEKARREARNLRERAKTAEEAAKAAKAEALRVRVGVQAGLPLDMCERLRGDTEDQLVADAQSLIEALGLTGRATPPGLPREAPGHRGSIPPGSQAGAESDLAKIGERIYAR
ncbi:hypothetical protein CSPHI_04990 [Corynebacterium sphenisci DSM 44792]|uniref:Scaffolding protein n=1 Tax=Corynebacterium sphenisci DSM 44792 TaxID=1437874 RepID=A0A1L7CXF4_9CORY|nr:hypothetical protein [Corynebacterium sphenisci]APT90498.1 hypothetical protein CSPHI_04990 [Corynebacterium sphenisci DSM 44792]